jgi:predicted DsbA family dithiol-disulfide isomerase
MSLKIPVAHDFVCPWCWVAVHQMEKLKREYEIEFEWLAYELWPADLPRPVTEPPREVFNRPPIPSRLDLMLALEHLTIPNVERDKKMNTHLPHLAAEFAKSKGMEEPFILELYRAYWERGEFIAEIEFLLRTGEPFGMDPDEMRKSIESEQFADRIVKFDAPAYKSGIFHVPTFIITGIRFAEQPYVVVEKAVADATRNAR